MLSRGALPPRSGGIARRRARRIASGILAGLLVVFTGGIGSAAVLPQFVGICPPGAPENSTLCTPEGFILLDEWASMGAGGAAAAPAVAVASSATGVTFAEAAVVAGQVGVLSVGGWYGGQIVVDLLSGSALDGHVAPPAPGLQAGWVGNTNTALLYVDGYTYLRNVAYTVTEAPAYGGSGYVNVTAALTSGTCAYQYAVSMSAHFYNTSGGGIGSYGSGAWDCSLPGSTSYFSGHLGPYSDFGHLSMPGGAVWYPVGAPGRSAGIPEGTGSTATATITYRCTNGTTIGTHAVEIPMTLQATANRINLGDLPCPAGEALVDVGVVASAPGYSPVELMPVTSTPEWVQNLPLEIPSCLGVGCYQALWRWDAPQAAWEFCGAAAVGCSGWATDPNRATNYQCRVGGVAVGLDVCSPLRKPGYVLPSVTTTEIVGPNATPVPVVAPLPAPTTPTTDPTWQNPENPSPGDPAYPVLSTTAPGGECFPHGWGVFNPVEWIYQPVKCALVWAFVPKASVVQASLDEGRAALDAHGVLRVVPQILLIPSSLTTGWTAPCTDSTFSVEPSAGHPQVFTLLPCSPPDTASAAGWTTARWIIGIFVVASTAWGCFLIVSSQFGKKGAE